jgi:hypothetical protein
MWLVSDLTPADIDHPQPGTVIAGRIEADHLGEPFKLGAMLIMQVLEPAARVSVLQRPEVGPVAGAWLERWEAPHSTCYSAASLCAVVTRASTSLARLRQRPAEKRHCSRAHVALAS